MKPAMLFKSTRDARGRAQLDGLVAHVSVPIPHSPDVVIFRGKVYVLHYEGIETYYREADVYHYQMNAVIVDGVELSLDEKGKS